jgi:hypothetical protein
MRLTSNTVLLILTRYCHCCVCNAHQACAGAGRWRQTLRLFDIIEQDPEVSSVHKSPQYTCVFAVHCKVRIPAVCTAWLPQHTCVFALHCKLRILAVYTAK